jgi:threonine/homoserine/homoserine lactone efflux protein
MELYTWLAFVVASSVLLAIPGPTILLVISYAIAHGRRVALASVAGVALGDLVAMSASLLGLGAIVLTSAKLFLVLKWVGAIYLVYLGIKMIRSAKAASFAAPEDGQGAAKSGVFWHAAAVTALNPKSIAFFIAFVPQFLKPEAPLGGQFVVLIGTFVGLAALNALAYALLTDLLRKRILRPAVLPWLTRVGGGLLVAMGVGVAALRKATA